MASSWAVVGSWSVALVIVPHVLYSGIALTPDPPNFGVGGRANGVSDRGILPHFEVVGKTRRGEAFHSEATPGRDLRPGNCPCLKHPLAGMPRPYVSMLS